MREVSLAARKKGKIAFVSPIYLPWDNYLLFLGVVFVDRWARPRAAELV